MYGEVLQTRYGLRTPVHKLMKQCLEWLRDEMRLIRPLVVQLAQQYDVDADIEQVTKAMARKTGLRLQDLVPITEQLRSALMPWVKQYLLDIPNDYVRRAHTMRTPTYLETQIPAAAAFNYDSFCPSRVALFYFITANVKITIPETLATWVHEELGHELHFYRVTTSSIAPLYARLENSFTDALTEGISFQREKQFLTLLQRPQAQQSVIPYLRDVWCSSPAEIEFTIRQMRVIRFLRVIGDIDINTCLLNIVRFLALAEHHTGVSSRVMYHELFPEQMNGPGYAITYAVVGQAIDEIEQQFHLSSNTAQWKAWNDYAMQLGYLPTDAFLQKLRERGRAGTF